MSWLAAAYLVAAFGMMVTGFLLMLDAGLHLVRRMRGKDRG